MEDIRGSGRLLASSSSSISPSWCSRKKLPTQLDRAAVSPRSSRWIIIDLNTYYVLSVCQCWHSSTRRTSAEHQGQADVNAEHHRLNRTRVQALLSQCAVDTSKLTCVKQLTSTDEMILKHNPSRFFLKGTGALV